MLETTKGTFEKFLTTRFGTPENPMDEASFEAKFDSCACKARCPKTAEELETIKRTIRALDKLDDMRELAALL